MGDRSCYDLHIRLSEVLPEHREIREYIDSLPRQRHGWKSRLLETALIEFIRKQKLTEDLGPVEGKDDFVVSFAKEKRVKPADRKPQSRPPKQIPREKDRDILDEALPDQGRDVQERDESFKNMVASLGHQFSE